jgi:hypothetical protein
MEIENDVAKRDPLNSCFQAVSTEHLMIFKIKVKTSECGARLWWRAKLGMGCSSATAMRF